MKIVNRERQSVFASPPRRNSEEWHEHQQRVDTRIAFMDDTWLYRWNGRGHPPEPFRLHKTLFKQCTPADISKNGWTVLKLAVGDLSETFGIRLKESDFKIRTGQRPTYEVEWLLLNRYYRCPCILGVYGDECVVAATKASHKRFPFVPFNQYKIIRQNSEWKNQKYRSGYRHFQAQFDIGYSFFTAQKHYPCDITYGVDVGVHGNATVWAVLNVNGIWFPAPFRAVLGSDLTDLPGKVGQISENCEIFVKDLGASYLRANDADSVYDMICQHIDETDVPQWVQDEVRTDPQLDRCTTRLDVLLVLMKAMNLRLDDDGITSLITLTQKFIPQKKENRYEY
jgi:hypothetical protein